MAGSQNVQIPLSLFNDIVIFFEYLNIKNYSAPSIYKYCDMLAELREKQHCINLRTTYTRMIYAKDESQRDSAREDYLCLRKKRKGGRCDGIQMRRQK